jgi:N utilization substance protein A
VRKLGQKVRVVLSRANPDLVRRLFELEVPEISDGIIEIRSVEREPGYRTKLGVLSLDPKIDCVGACVGVRGTRIKSIIDELNGEKIDVIPWDEDPEALIINALKPAVVSNITLDYDNRKALVIVDEDQLSLAIGRRGQNVRLASKLARWEIDIMTREQLEATAEADAGGGEAGEPDAAEAPEPGVDKLDAAEAEPLGVGAVEADTAEAGAGEPDAAEAPEPGVDKLDTAEAEPLGVGAVEADTAEAGVGEPGVAVGPDEETSGAPEGEEKGAPEPG